MNIFILDTDPVLAARMLCDSHVGKMALESVQMLSTVAHQVGVPAPYKPTHEGIMPGTANTTAPKAH